jgi:DNA excision repair protein ERCC-3
VAIQISGTFGSRQEEAQRLGRILRPKPGSNQAHFYSVVSLDTVEQDFALKRQLFLCEQGYEYVIRDDPGTDAEEAGAGSDTLEHPCATPAPDLAGRARKTGRGA